MVGHVANRMLAQPSESDRVVPSACTEHARSLQFDDP
jgi:hypothetical protein